MPIDLIRSHPITSKSEMPSFQQLTPEVSSLRFRQAGANPRGFLITCRLIVRDRYLRVRTEIQAIVFVTCQSPRHLAGNDRCLQMTNRNVPVHASGTRTEF